MSKYFTIEELCHSDIATAKGIDNTPTKDVKENLQALIDNVLDPLREAYGKPIYVNSGYRSPELNKAVGGVSNSQHCLDRNTEILTNHGWKSIGNININDMVFSYNMKKEIIELTPIDEIIKFHYNGIMYYANNNHIQFAVTEKHRMLLRYEKHKYKRKTDKELSEKLKSYTETLKTNNEKYHIEPVESAFMKRRIYLCAKECNNTNTYDVDVLRLCMATIADGFLHYKNNKFTGIGFNLKKERDKQELENILENLGWTYSKRYSKTHEKQGCLNVYQYHINHKICKEVYEIIGREKKIPTWFLSLKSGILKRLVITYAKFDGSIDKRENCNNITIFSKDEENIDMIQAMSILSGMRCIKKEFKNHAVRINGREHILKKFFHLYINQVKNESKLNNNIENFHRFYYNSDVWCVNNKNTTLITRRNGKVVILGNCKGEAADIDVHNTEENQDLYDYITRNLEYDQCLFENNGAWIHVSYKKDGNNRKQAFALNA